MAQQEDLINSTDPAAVIAEATAAFSKSIQFALAEVQRQVRDEVQNICAESRLERDEALKTVHASQLEAQSCKLELGTCHASLKQAEMTIVHQNNTIAQLKREITQWQDQSRNWQEHFLRVEQRRCSLATRLDEALTRQHSHLQSDSFLPQVNEASTSQLKASNTLKPNAESPSLADQLFPIIDDPPVLSSTPPTSTPAHKTLRTPQSAVKPAKTPKRVSKPTNVPEPDQTSVRARQISTTRENASRSAAHAPSLPEKGQVAQSTVIRRVKTIINLPIKHEDSEDGLIPIVELALTANDANSALSSSTRCRRNQKRSIPLDAYENDGGDAEQYDDDWVQDDAAESDEDDELMIGAEDTGEDMYQGRTHASPRGTSSHTPPVTRGRNAPSPRKRKSDAAPKGKPPAKTRRL
ncbi:hypothetical protein HGRIS_006497 [Hohenbuehelia grisea]|uniref:Shugoshin C-terminal domain-containing protein n=1 Tax=Hohenbuehelia grisea TaxID=104357 RepID=A0ABR3J9F0_9AGAR